jgi:phosphoketolase
MPALSDTDRFSLVLRAAECLLEPSPRAESLRILVREERERHCSYIREHGQVLSEVRNRRWGSLREPQDERTGNYGEMPGRDA